MTGMTLDLVPEEARMKVAAGEGYATATDLADWLVRTLKMPFRDAHHVTGGSWRRRRSRASPCTRCRSATCRPSSRKSPSVFDVLSVQASVESRTSYGGTAPANVRTQAQEWLKRLEKEQNSG
jgi:argininosuccinate lyase